jgi:hypothetical protein
MKNTKEIEAFLDEAKHAVNRAEMYAQKQLNNQQNIVNDLDDIYERLCRVQKSLDLL